MKTERKSIQNQDSQRQKTRIGAYNFNIVVENLGQSCNVQKNVKKALIFQSLSTVSIVIDTRVTQLHLGFKINLLQRQFIYFSFKQFSRKMWREQFGFELGGKRF